MNTKLTLSVDPRIVEAAKRYADEHGTSVSRLVEDYLAVVTGPVGKPSAPVLDRLRGSLAGEDVDRDDWRRHLDEKHG